MYKQFSLVAITKVIVNSSILISVTAGVLIYYFIYKELSPEIIVGTILICQLLKETCAKFSNQVNLLMTAWISCKRIDSFFLEKKESDKNFLHTLEPGLHKIILHNEDKINEILRLFSTQLSLKNENIYVNTTANPFVAGSVLDNLFIGEKNDLDRINYYLMEFKLVESINECPQFLALELTDNGTNLSGGQRQRLLFIRALLSEAEIFVLYEPLNAIPDTFALEIFENIPSYFPKNVSIFIVSKMLSEDICNSLYSFSENGNLEKIKTIKNSDYKESTHILNILNQKNANKILSNISEKNSEKLRKINNKSSKK
ncbi:ATP-binding cassette domain-containing protein [Fluviispira vulneris]|uniref:ATP-binding cassette domain-containing protein n=1 Tax=Fluviispira vulneris TaxID=2763012 RepID=UPI00164800BE|nr:ATP-binding cassette domain-containing protein [Fluviispira vulneris]